MWTYFRFSLYLYSKLGIEPTSRVEVEYDGDQNLQSITKTEPEGTSEEDIQPPPFTSLYFDVHPSTTSLTPIPQGPDSVHRDHQSGWKRKVTGNT